jgi:hypothetical protein
MAITPSDVNAQHNVRATIRRMLREDGIQVDRPKTTAARAPNMQQRMATVEGHVAQLRKEIAELKRKIV